MKRMKQAYWDQCRPERKRKRWKCNGHSNGSARKQAAKEIVILVNNESDAGNEKSS